MFTMVFKPVSNDQAVTMACVEFWISDNLLLGQDLKGDTIQAHFFWNKLWYFLMNDIALDLCLLLHRHSILKTVTDVPNKSMFQAHFQWRVWQCIAHKHVSFFVPNAFLWLTLHLLFKNAHITYHSDSIIEQALSKYHNIELLVDADVLKHSEHSNRFYGRDDGGEEEILLQVNVLHTKSLDLADGKQGDANANGIPQGANNSIPQHRNKILKERPSGHEVAWV